MLQKLQQFLQHEQNVFYADIVLIFFYVDKKN